MSVVGNIDVAKQVLRRLSHEWQTNTGYRNYTKSRVNKPSPQSHNENWWGSFDKQGWSYCGHSRYCIGTTGAILMAYTLSKRQGALMLLLICTQQKETGNVTTTTGQFRSPRLVYLTLRLLHDWGQLFVAR